jgi:hypothetical protein
MTFCFVTDQVFTEMDQLDDYSSGMIKFVVMIRPTNRNLIMPICD